MHTLIAVSLGGLLGSLLGAVIACAAFYLWWTVIGGDDGYTFLFAAGFGKRYGAIGGLIVGVVAGLIWSCL